MRLGFIGFTAAALVAAAVGLGSAMAHDRSVAKRCDAYGCRYIHCNWSGDRCFRVDEDRDGNRIYRGYYGEGGGDRYADDREEQPYRESAFKSRERRDGNPYWRSRHHRRDRYDDDVDLNAPHSPHRRHREKFDRDDRYQDRYRYDDRW